MPKIYKIVFGKRAARFFSIQPVEQQKRLAVNISKLPQGDTRQLKGHKGYYRLRVGEYRVIYTINHDELIIAILSIGNRGDIYKKI
jgi:mRNA interferase RelE/StbE